MQMYSTARSLQGTEPNRMRKLSALIRPSHRTIHRLTRHGSSRGLGTAVVVLLALGCSAAGTIETPPMRPSSELIDAAALARDLSVIAADSMRGRETGTPDAMRAARFIGERLAAMGLEPVGDSMFFQRVPLVRQTLSPGSRIVVTGAKGTQPLRIGEDVAPMLTLGEGQPDPRRFVSGDIVFAGYALRSKELGRDDFTSLDMANKVVVFLH